MSTNDRRTSNTGGLPTANFGPKYEQHMKQMQKQLADAEQKITDLEGTIQQLTYDIEKKQDELEVVQNSCEAEEEEKTVAEKSLNGYRREVEKQEVRLSEVKLVSIMGQ